MKAAIVTTIMGFMACTVIAAPVPQWVPPPRPGGVAWNTPIGGVNIGPDGFYANGLLGGVGIGGGPPPPPQGGWGRGWNTDVSANTAAEGGTAQHEEEAAKSAEVENVEDTD